ncbi:calcium-independent phospholipase A2-gamma [Babesia gibsoni]|uniref:Calcium-independent phospholipase A2-gamma n=1 Tax=Babesia gibsoni TaxID=33632 RepID=A0AAD8UUY0_BABGI|nr:calcium-independent phospholipase A2-gamma [Babesia gibsoni]
MRLSVLSWGLLFTLIPLGMWRVQLNSPNANHLSCRAMVAARKVRHEAFLVTSTRSNHAVDLNDGPRRSFLTRRSKVFLTTRRPSFTTLTHLLSVNMASEDVVGGIGKACYCAIHSLAAAECGGMMGHVEGKLLTIACTKGSPHQLKALHSLKLLLESDRHCINHLLSLNSLDELIKVLRQPYQKNIWEVMNSYLWSGSSKAKVRLKMVQDTVLSILIIISRSNDAAREHMAQSELLKGLLMRIYLYEMKKKERKEKGKAVEQREELSQKPGPANDCLTENDACSLDSSNSGQSSIYKDDQQGAPEDAYGGLMMIKDSIVGNSQTLVRKLFHNLGYEINEISVKERYERSLENDEQIETELYDSEDLLPYNTALQQKHGQVQHDYPRNRNEPEKSGRIIWVPYMVRKNDANNVDSIRRHVHIHLGEDVGDLCSMDSVETSTIDTTDKVHGDLLFGMVAIRANPELEKSEDEQPRTSKMLREGDTQNDAAGEGKMHRYSIISSVKMSTSDELNVHTMTENLLKKLKTVNSLKVLDYIVHEIWTLLGTKDTGVLQLIQSELDLERLAKIINASLEHQPKQEDTVDEKKVHSEMRVLQMLQGLKNKLLTYLSTIMNGLAPHLYNTDNMEAIEDKISHAHSESSMDITTSYKDDEITSKQALDERVAVARSLQTAVFGMLIDYIYLNGNTGLCAIRECTPLVEAIKTVRSTLPTPMRVAEVLDNRLEDYIPLMEGSSEDMRNDTRVAHHSTDSASVENREDLHLRQRDQFGNIMCTANDYGERGWLRHKCVDRPSRGAFYNCHKLLNILGHHDQGRFKNRGMRILAIDGGGSKGVIALEVLRRLETEVGKPLHEAFDIICGTSCGGLLAALLALEKMTVGEVQESFEQSMEKVFARDSYRATGTRLLMKQAYYDETALQNILLTLFGDKELIDYSVDPKCPKFFCLSVQMTSVPMKPVVWRNYNYPLQACDITGNEAHMHPRDGSFIIRAADAIRATTAAPMYFPLLERNGILYGDGALHANNPSMIAMLEAKMLYPNVPIDCIVSVGTGIPTEFPRKRQAETDLEALPKKSRITGSGGVPTEVSADDDSAAEVATVSPGQDRTSHTFSMKDLLLQSLNMPMTSDPKSLGLDQLINHVIGSATNTEQVHSALHTLMDSKSYFRFNPKVPTVRIDETNPEVLKDLKERSRRYLEEDRQLKRMKELAELLKNME